MDYKAFFADVEAWIQQANQAAVRYGLASEQFWAWVAKSCGEMCRKYQDHRLVIKQMIMMVEWLEEVHEAQKGGRTN